MNWKDLLQAVLVIAVRFVLVWFFALIGVEIDVALLDTLVAAIVAYLLALFGVEVARARGVPGLR